MENSEVFRGKEVKKVNYVLNLLSHKMHVRKKTLLSLNSCHSASHPSHLTAALLCPREIILCTHTTSDTTAVHRTT